MAEKTLLKESLLRGIRQQEVSALSKVEDLQYIAIQYGIPMINRCNNPLFENGYDNEYKRATHSHTPANYQHDTSKES